MISPHASDTWRTPRKIFDPLHERHAFTLDIAADATNHLLPRWFGPDGDWCNPPYSRGYQLGFVEQALEAQRNNTSTVMLLPADTSTKLYHDYILRLRLPHEFIRGRLRFVGAPGPAKFGSMLVYF